MPTFGVQPTGFVPKTQPDIISELQASQRAIEPTMTFGAQEPQTQTIGAFAEQLAQVWEGLEVLAAGPAEAVGFRADQIAAITGTSRPQSEFSEVDVAVVTSGPTTLTAGVQRIRHRTQPGIEFVVLETTSIGAAGTHTVRFRAIVVGPVQAAAGTLTEIVTPAANWTGANNPADADPGRLRANDSELKDLRARELAGGGGSSQPGLLGNLSQTEGVRSVVVLNNRSTETRDGIPGKSVEAIVTGGSDADVAQTLFASAAFGAGFHGNTGVQVTDSAGGAHHVRFTRPVAVPIHIELAVATLPNYIGEAAHELELATDAEDQRLAGGDVFLSVISRLAFVEGVQRVTSLRIGRSVASLAAADISITPREIATFDTTIITITATPSDVV